VHPNLALIILDKIAKLSSGHVECLREFHPIDRLLHELKTNSQPR
jgi:hypothetical protein